jgi:hypothetical protein
MAAGGAQASGFQRVLDRHRHAVQRSPELAARECGIGFARAARRAGSIKRADGVQRRVMACNPREAKLDQLRGADAPRANRCGEFSGACERV